MKTFSDEKVKVISYQDATYEDFKTKNIICCLNSIHRRINIDENEIKNYVVYIDEITSFIDSFLYNDSLNSHLKDTYLMLMKVIKNCKKLIVSDAIINANVFNLLQQRKMKEKIFIVNKYQKYKDIEGIRYNDENKFLEQLKEHLKQNKHFLFGADSKSVITKYHDTLLKLYPEKLKDFILITADTVKKINDVI